MSERTAVYRLYGSEDVLLYVGIARNFGQRWYRHASAKEWWLEVARQTVEWHPDRKTARRVEAEAIRDEKPRYNIATPEPVAPRPPITVISPQHPDPEQPPAPVRYLSQVEISEAFGVTRHLVNRWRCRYDDFPAPDSVTGDGMHAVPGWLPERMHEIREWEASRPGQGAGGGRPRKQPA